MDRAGRCPLSVTRVRNPIAYAGLATPGRMAECVAKPQMGTCLKSAYGFKLDL